MYLPVPLGLQALAARERRQAVDEEILSDSSGALSLDEGSKTTGGVALLAGGDEGVLAGLADELLLRGGGAADGQQTDGIALVHVAQARVSPPHVPLPVRVVGDVAGGRRHGVGVLQRVVGPRRRTPEVRV